MYNRQSVLKFADCFIIMTKQTRRDSSIVDRNELITLLDELGMFLVVEVAHLEFHSLEVTDTKSVEGQGRPRLVI